MPRAAIAGLALSVFAVAALASVPREARAADDEGQYAVRGAGLINCALFVQARETKSDAYLVTAAWVDGYITGINEYAPDTYDALSFESSELLMAILNEHCATHPTDPVFGVLNSLVTQIREDRLTHKSEKITITVGDHEAQHYVELIRRMQQRLADRGFYEGPVNGEFKADTIAAIKRFQKSIDFNQTGFPDQTTLWRLFRAE